MAIAFTHITTAGNGSGLTSYSTASGSPTANSLQLLMVGSQTAAATVNVPTITGAGLTWVEVVTAIDSGNQRRCTLFRALGTPSVGALTIDFAGQSQIRCGWSWSEASGVDTSGTNGSGAIVQSASALNNGGTVTGLTVTLGAFSSTNNATYGAIRHGTTTAQTVTPGTGFNELGEAPSGSFITYQSQYNLANDTSVDWTWPSESAFDEAVAAEIKAFVPSTPTGGGGLVGVNNLNMLNLNQIPQLL